MRDEESKALGHRAPLARSLACGEKKTGPRSSFRTEMGPRMPSVSSPASRRAVLTAEASFASRFPPSTTYISRLPCGVVGEQEGASSRRRSAEPQRRGGRASCRGAAGAHPGARRRALAAEEEVDARAPLEVSDVREDPGRGIVDAVLLAERPLRREGASEGPVLVRWRRRAEKAGGGTLERAGREALGAPRASGCPGTDLEVRGRRARPGPGRPLPRRRAPPPLRQLLSDAAKRGGQGLSAGRREAETERRGRGEAGEALWLRRRARLGGHASATIKNAADYHEKGAKGVRRHFERKCTARRELSKQLSSCERACPTTSSRFVGGLSEAGFDVEGDPCLSCARALDGVGCAA